MRRSSTHVHQDLSIHARMHMCICVHTLCAQRALKQTMCMHACMYMCIFVRTLCAQSALKQTMCMPACMRMCNFVCALCLQRAPSNRQCACMCACICDFCVRALCTERFAEAYVGHTVLTLSICGPHCINSIIAYAPRHSLIIDIIRSPLDLLRHTFHQDLSIHARMHMCICVRTLCAQSDFTEATRMHMRMHA